MGIHSGLVQAQIDIAGGENVVGEGINTAQRVMDFGEAGHILLSGQYAAWLQQFDEWKPQVHRIGEGTAKHGLKVEVYSLHGEDFGRGDPPAGLRSPSRRDGRAAPPERRSGRSRCSTSPSLQPDEEVLRTAGGAAPRRAATRSSSTASRRSTPPGRGPSRSRSAAPTR